MDAMSPARRVRLAFMRVGILISALAFFLVGATTLFDQWIAGYASARFMLGTAFLSAGACLGLFATITAIGSAVSWLFSDEAPGTEQRFRPPLREVAAQPPANDPSPQAGPQAADLPTPAPASGYLSVADRAAFDRTAGVGKAA
jgi:hypothetical protein